MPSEGQRGAKRTFLGAIGADRVVAIGNGFNDGDLLEHAALSIAVLSGEGSAPETLFAADVVCANICDALDLLLIPKRLVATLRR